MTMSHCRHDWVPCSDALRESFPRFSDEVREFRACVRCLRIEELEPATAVVDVPTVPGDRRAA